MQSKGMSLWLPADKHWVLHEDLASVVTPSWVTDKLFPVTNSHPTPYNTSQSATRVFTESITRKKEVDTQKSAQKTAAIQEQLSFIHYFCNTHIQRMSEICV